MNDEYTDKWLVRAWNRGKPWRRFAKNIHEYNQNMNGFVRDIRHAIGQKVWDRAPRGVMRNRYGANNRRWRKHIAQRPRVLFSTPFFDIVAD